MKKTLVTLMCTLLAFLLCSCSYIPLEVPTPDYNGELIVHFIDVGQGDSILLESQNEFMLIDAGEAEYGSTVCRYLENNDVKTLSYVVATHPHSDHCGGLTEVINSFECENFITVETDQQTKTWLNVLYAVKNNNVNYIDAKVGTTYTLGNSSFQIMGPHSNYYEDYNNYSVVIKATCGKNTFLFTGDAEILSENEMLDYILDLSSDVLKVGHHGSSTSSSYNFLSAVSPQYAVISCAEHNDYGHPHNEVVSRLNNMGISTYRTDKHGTVVATSDGNNIEFYCDNSHIPPIDPKTLSYLGNKNSKKFHLSTCSGAMDINKYNLVSFSSREEALSKGYSPCKACNP